MADMVEIPPYLVDQVRAGNVILILGAGASVGAADAKGNHPPSAKALGELLATRFLGGPRTDLSLAQVAEYAISESNVTEVQEYIRDLLAPFAPTPAHFLLPTFRWRGLATTNYDRLIERAYEGTKEPLQRIAAFIENGDRVDSALRDPDAVPLLKLHGCITRTTHAGCPFILTPDQYITHKAGRSRLFTHLEEWATERPIVFIGHGLQDSDLRALLLDLTTKVASRPRYYAVTPNVEPLAQRFWDSRRISLLACTFDEFMTGLSSAFPAPLRALSGGVVTAAHPIAKHFRVPDGVLSSGTLHWLTTDAQYVEAVAATTTVSPERFYKGMNPGWSAIEQTLDVRRHVVDTVLTDYFLIEESLHQPRPEFVLIKAAAGAGKTVIMRRIAWDASREFGRLCLYLSPSGTIDSAAIQELIGLCKERLFLFVDDASDRVRELAALGKKLGPDGQLLTVVLAERVNEWNVNGNPLEPFITTTYEVGHLSTKEINGLLALLSKHRALGTLEGRTSEARQAAFQERAGRQLLVALHEATLGRPFEDIVENEFRAIQPVEARQMYLTISVLNRLNVPVRAGLVARVHGIPFEDFQNRLFLPLEDVVYAEFDPVIRDYVYRTRHPHIAAIVFERILRSQEERYDAYQQCLGALNIDYSVDRRAFRSLMRGRTILELFPNHALAVLLQKKAFDISPSDQYLYHQFAIYEMNRPNGNFEEAAEYLAQAARLAPSDATIKHSQAELDLHRADASVLPLQKAKYLRDAAELSQTLKRDATDGAYGYHTLAKVRIRELRELLDAPEGTDLSEPIRNLLRDIEANLSDGLQRFPEDPYLLEVDAKLAELLNDSKRAVASLEASLAGNPRSTYVAMRLSKLYAKGGDDDRALTALETALEVNPGERRLHFAIAQLLLRTAPGARDSIVYHLERSYVPGDKNYAPQLLLARQLFLNGEADRSRDVFTELKRVPAEVRLREGLLYPLETRFTGSVLTVEASYCFILRDGPADRVYAHRSNVEKECWPRLGTGRRVSFRIAFNLRGPTAFDVRLATD